MIAGQMAGNFKLIFSNFLKSLHQIWLEVTGTFQLIFAAAFGYYAIKQSVEINDAIQNVRNAGYEVVLALEATIGFNKKAAEEANAAAPPEE